MKDLELLKARFLTCEFSREDEYLTRHFKDRARQQLIIYYKIFPYQGGVGIKRFHKNFTDHTGIHCSVRWIYKTLSYLKKLELALARATTSSDFEMISLIKTGSERQTRAKLRLYA